MEFPYPHVSSLGQGRSADFSVTDTYRGVMLLFGYLVPFFTATMQQNISRNSLLAVNKHTQE